MSDNKMIDYGGAKLNKRDYEIITSIIKEHHFISRSKEKPPENFLDLLNSFDILHDKRDD